MNRLIALGVFILALATAAAIWMWLTRNPPDAPVAPIHSADYASPDAWAARPATPPAAVWEGGWAVDVFLVLNAAARSPAPLKTLAARDARAIKDAADLAEGLASIGPVYAPVYAADDPGSDLARAFETYLATDNRGRAFVIATDQPLPASLVEVLNADTMVRERFGGILQLTSPSANDSGFDVFIDGVEPTAYCPERFAQPEDCVATVSVARRNGHLGIADKPPVGGTVMNGFLDWLDSSAVQLAEPLGELEDVAVVDIRRPGETDSSREGSADNDQR